MCPRLTRFFQVLQNSAQPAQRRWQRHHALGWICNCIFFNKTEKLLHCIVYSKTSASLPIFLLLHDKGPWMSQKKLNRKIEVEANCTSPCSTLHTYQYICLPPNRLGLSSPGDLEIKIRGQGVYLRSNLWKHPQKSREVRQGKTRQPIKGLLSSQFHWVSPSGDLPEPVYIEREMGCFLPNLSIMIEPCT